MISCCKNALSTLRCVRCISRKVSTFPCKTSNSCQSFQKVICVRGLQNCEA